MRWALIAVILIGVALRFAYAGRPLDGRIHNPWRQADYFQLTRNFFRENGSLFYPQVDWRADTPGFAEMELPLIPWTGAQLYRIFGEHVQVVRVLAATLESASLVVFAALALRILPPTAAVFAVLAFALNPILVTLASSLQPEPLMHLSGLLVVMLLWRWSEWGDTATLLAAAAMTALAILAKLPAVYLGFVLAYWVVRTLGRRALVDPRVYAATLVAVVPPLAWYAWARHFWTTYGLSLGVSNESHFIGWDLLLPPTFVFGLAATEILMVFSPAGWLLALAALRAPRARWEPLLAWYGATLIFYVVTARTTGDWWASYYHLISVAPACLLMGLGFAVLRSTVISARPRYPGLALTLAVVTVMLLMAATAYRIHRRDHGSDDLVAMHACVTDFAAHVPASERIVVRGGSRHDERGHPVAHNESMAFAWMDRKGFNYADEDLGIATLESIAARGGRYWIASDAELRRGRLRQDAEARFRRVAACARGFALYDLGGPGA